MMEVVQGLRRGEMRRRKRENPPKPPFSHRVCWVGDLVARVRVHAILLGLVATSGSSGAPSPFCAVRFPRAPPAVSLSKV